MGVFGEFGQEMRMAWQSGPGKRAALAGLVALVLGLALAAAPARAATNLVTNGGFETCVTSTTVAVIVPCANGQVQYTGGPVLQGWTTTSTYSFLIPPSAFATTA